MEESRSKSRSKAEKRLRKDWLLKYNTQKIANFESLFPAKNHDDKNKHYILKFDIQKIEKQIIDENKAEKGKDTKGEHYDVQLNFSFFHRKHGKFYGRTYTTSKIRGTCERGFFKARNIKEDIYFYSTVVNKHIFLIVDLLIVKTKPERDDKYFSGGYFIIDMFQDKTNNQTVVFYSENTPRELLIKGKFEQLIDQTHVSTMATLFVDKVKKKRDIELYNQISKSVPPHTLMGRNDEIPGVRNILDVRADADINHFKDTMYLHDVRIEVTKNWEAQLMNDLGIMLSQKYDTVISNSREAIKIYERILKIQVHNTWTI